MLARPALLTLFLGLSFCGPDETISGYAGTDTVWDLAELDGTKPGFAARIRFPREGRVEGEGPCGPYAARQTAPYPWLAVEGLDTPPGCDASYRAALATMTLAEVAGDMLILSNDAGDRLVFRLSGGE